MPTLNIPQTIDIAPERYLNACSRSELFELNMLLGSPRFSAQLVDDDLSDDHAGSGTSGEMPKAALEDTDQNSYQNMCTIFPSHQDEAMEIMREISNICRLSMADIFLLMKPFRDLEKLRIKSLVQLPQARDGGIYNYQTDDHGQ